jgi:glycosyltransferase involved in cell wall biosynthesis
MRIVSIGYSKTKEYTVPEEWLERIGFYTGILEALAGQYKVDSIERINYEGHCRQNGVDYHFILLKNKVERFPWKLHRLLKALKPGVVLVNGFIFPLQIIQLRLALGKEVKILVLHRAEKPFPGVKKWLQAGADRCVDGYMFAAAEFGKQWTANGNIRSEKKIHEIIQGSSSFKPEDQGAARKRLNVAGSPVYLWVGRLEKNKDPLTVMKAFSTFHLLQPSAKLYMVFQTEELLEDVKETIRTNKAESAIELVGKIAHKELQTWFSAADFLISGSHYEGSGIAVSEAMSCGCIPLVTDIISFRKMVGDCGFLYDAGDTHSLLQILQQSLTINIPAQKKAVMEKFQQELSFKAIAQKIHHLITNMQA